MTGPPVPEFRLFGRFAVVRDGAEVPAGEFGGRKVRMLLRILGSRQGHFVSNDALTEMLWPQQPPGDPAANLQVLVNRARRALGDPALIRTGPGGYSLAPGDSCTVDTERFLSAVALAAHLDGRPALAALSTALELWRGEPLAEDAYADWADGYRSALLRARQGAAERAALLALSAGLTAHAVELATTAADGEPLREAAVLALVRSLAAAGDPAAALTRYERFRRELADELGVDPSGTAQAVQRQLLDGALGPAATSGGTEHTTGAAMVQFTELPFVGRQAVLGAATSAFGAPGGATVLLTGGSGAGKSRLLRALCERVPTVLVRCSAPERAEPWSLVRTLAREVLALDVAVRDELVPPLAAALARLLPELEQRQGTTPDAETQRALLNEAAIRLLGATDQVLAVDDVQWADPTSLALLAAARARLPELRLLLAFRSEEIQDPPALLQPDRVDRHLVLGGLTRQALGELIANRVLVDTLLTYTDGSPLAITEVVRALAGDGLIRPRGGKWEVSSPIAVTHARNLGAQGQRAATLARVERVSPEAREVLDLLCLQARETPIAVLATALSETQSGVLDRLDTLTLGGLVRLGELGWSIAHDQIGAARASAFSDARAARLHALLAGALESIDADPAEQARHWRAAGQLRSAAITFARAARMALNTRADREAIELAGQGLSCRPSDAVAAELRELRAQARGRVGELLGAREDLTVALAAHPTGPVRSRLLGQLAALASGADDAVRAAGLAELALVEAGADDTARARALETAGMLDMNLSRPARAAQRLAEARSLYAKVGDGSGIARVLDVQAMATFLSGDVRGGGAALRQAADLFSDSGDLMRVVTPRSTSGHAMVFAGRPADGVETISAAVDLARTLGHPEGQSYALWHRAEALAALDRADDATTDANEALAIAVHLGHRGWTATGWRAVGIAALSRGELDEARRAFLASLDAADHLDLFGSWAAARVALTLVALGSLDAAGGFVARSLAQGPPLGHYEARLAQVELAHARGDAATDTLAATALSLALAGGVVQGNARLAELAGW